MLSLKVIRLDFMKASSRVLNACRRNMGMRGNPMWENSENLTANHIKAVQESKLTPKGFETIYACPLYSTVQATYSVIPIAWGFLCVGAYILYTKEEEEQKQKQRRLELSKKDMCMAFVSSITLIFVIHSILRKVVVAIFRRENEFQALFHGFFGLLSKTYVRHGLQAVESTSRPGVYKLNGKTVIVFTNGFKDVESFYSVVKFGGMP